MKDATTPPWGSTVGVMAWPYPGHGGTFWRDFILAEGMAPRLALEGHAKALEDAWADLYAEVRAGVLEQLRADMPRVAQWAESVDWLQTCGRGDVVAIMSLHSGAILSHCCIGWRDDYRDASGALWNWEWVLASLDVVRPERLVETRADASGCILDKQGRPTSKVLVCPAIGGDERDGILARWQATMGEALRDMPPVRTVPVEHAEVDWDAYERHMADVYAAALGGSDEMPEAPWRED